MVPGCIFRLGKACCIVLLLAASLPLPGQPADPMPGAGPANLDHLQELKAPDVPPAIAELAALPDEHWETLATPNFTKGYSEKTFSLRLALRNTGETGTWYLGLPNNRLDYVDFRLVTPRGVQQHSAGDRLVWSGAEPVAHPVFRFRLEAGQSGTLYMQIRSSALISFRPYLQSAEAFGRARAHERLIEIGCALVFLLLIISQFLLNPRSNILLPLYFAAAMLFGAIFIWTRFGNGALYLYPGSIYLKHNGVFLSILACQIFLLLFFHRFLEIGTLSPRVDRLLFWSAILLAATYPIYWLDIPLAQKNTLWLLSLPFVQGVILAGFVVALRARRRWVLYIFWGWVVAESAAVALILMQAKVLPYSIVALYGLVITIPIWFILLLVATAQRYMALRRERDGYLEQIVDRLREETIAGVRTDESEVEPKTDAAALAVETETAAAPSTPLAGTPSERRVQALDTETLLEALMRLVKEERLYLNDELSLEDFAARLSIRPDQLSALLNLRMGISFSRLINQHRIEEARRRLREYPEHTVLRIGLDCGFGSRSAFNREFKRYSGMSPAAFRDQENPR